MDQLVLFYAWQSDRDSKLCRDFIARTLVRAKEILRADGINLIVDSDTQDVPGMPPVLETVLGKIRDCDIFLGDMTFVAQTRDGKQIPNPNVMAEYGYALHAKGHAQILLVMNEAFGSPEELPFDLTTYRFPLRYEAAPGIADSERRSALKSRVQNLPI